MMKRMKFCFLMLSLSISIAVDAQDLEKNFKNYADAAKTRTWWHWMNGTITKEGIKYDLQQMKEAGIGGAYIFNVSNFIPVGPVKLLSKQWFEMTAFAVEEASKQQIEIGMHNCPGWATSGGPWIDLEHAMQQIVSREVHVTGGKKVDVFIEDPAKREPYYYKDVVVLAFPTVKGDGASTKGFRIDLINHKTGNMRFIPEITYTPGKTTVKDNAIEKSRIIDVSAFMDKDGHLVWNAPDGQWTVIRFGHTYINQNNYPAPAEGFGLECDKFSKKAVKLHFDAYTRKLIENSRQHAGKTFKTVIIDSYEAGRQTWTSAFREEFKQRRGYDMTKWMPCLTGRVVESLDLTERFLWDYRRTISDLYADHYYKYMQEMLASYNMLLATEPYGDHMVNQMDIGAHSGIFTTEFWHQGKRGSPPELAASLAHTYGSPYVEAEAFTSLLVDEGFSSHPYSFKAVGDQMYARGVNRFTFHTYAHQARPDIKPGITMGPHGSYINAGNTWWKPGKAWFDYLARTQAMLQTGVNVADVLLYAGEDVPRNIAKVNLGTKNDVPATGYAIDFCNTDVLLNHIDIKNGKILLPNGANYRLLVLPGTPNMSSKVLARIKELVAQGMVVLGIPPTVSSGLSEYPTGDTKVKNMADELWGTDKQHAGTRQYGNGKVFWEMAITEVMEKLGVPRDFHGASKPGANQLTYTHRTTGDADIYFIANDNPKPERRMCTFRVEGKHPEFWDATTGKIYSPAVYEHKNGLTSLPIDFAPSGAAIVVFRKKDAKPKPISSCKINSKDVLQENFVANEDGTLSLQAFENGTYEIQTASGQKIKKEVSTVARPMAISSGWEVYFDPILGGPGKVNFKKPMSWIESPQDGIKHYSGSAIYTRDFKIGQLAANQCYYLDIGQVCNIAEVKINGKLCGVLWAPPYRIDITEQLKIGINAVQITVTNTWNNRLIGDERYPSESEYYKTDRENQRGSLAIRKLPDWFYEGKARPASKRITFSTWNIYNNPSYKLLDAGLIGDIAIISSKRLQL